MSLYLAQCDDVLVASMGVSLLIVYHHSVEKRNYWSKAAARYLQCIGPRGEA
jgi:hypothetical protein